MSNNFNAGRFSRQSNQSQGASQSQSSSVNQTSSQISSSHQTSTSSSSQQTSSTTTKTSSSTTVTTSTFTRAYAEARLSNFRLEGGTLRIDLRNETDETIEQMVNLDDHLGFANDSLSWEATKFSEENAAIVKLAGSIITATYNNVESKVDLFEKLRIHNGIVIVLSFQKRMYTQVPWMNFRILALPTITPEMEEMMTMSTVKIASSTVSVATTSLMREITTAIQKSMSSVQTEIMSRVTMEMACLKESIQEDMLESIRATDRSELRSIGWGTLDTEYNRIRG